MNSDHALGEKCSDSQVQPISSSSISQKKLAFFCKGPPSAKDVASGIVLYRHLIALVEDGWEVRAIYPASTEIPGEFDASFRSHAVAVKKWYWPPVRAYLPGSLRLRCYLIKNSIRKKLGRWEPTANLVFPQSISIEFLGAVNMLCRSPTFCIVHDETAIFSATFSGARDVVHELLKKSKMVWSVSDELCNVLKDLGATASEVLHPLPSSSVIPACGEDAWKRLCIAIVGSRRGCSSTVAEVIKAAVRVGVKVIVMGGGSDEEKACFGQNVEYTPFFDTPEEAIRFVRDNASAVVLPYNVDDNQECMYRKILKNSFPSRFVEFSATGLPVICVAPADFAVSVWFKTNTELDVINSLEPKDIGDVISRLHREQYWRARRAEVVSLRRKYFDPNAIQSQFADAIDRSSVSVHGQRVIDLHEQVN